MNTAVGNCPKAMPGKVTTELLDKPGAKQHNPPLNVGGVPERSKGSDCKSDGSAFGGSNPPPSTTLLMNGALWMGCGFRGSADELAVVRV